MKQILMDGFSGILDAGQEEDRKMIENKLINEDGNGIKIIDGKKL